MGDGGFSFVTELALPHCPTFDAGGPAVDAEANS
jgi:hypothetical protein